jgi:hypothetical protein
VLFPRFLYDMALDKPPSEPSDAYRLSAGTVWSYREILAVNEVP